MGWGPRSIRPSCKIIVSITRAITAISSRRNTSSRICALSRLPSVSHDVRQFGRYLREGALPVAIGLLAKKPHGWIPGGIVTIETPPPVRHVFEDSPDRTAERASQMCYCGVGCDNEIEVLHDRGCIQECIRPGIESISQRFDVKLE